MSWPIPRKTKIISASPKKSLVTAPKGNSVEIRILVTKTTTGEVTIEYGSPGRAAKPLTLGPGIRVLNNGIPCPKTTGPTVEELDLTFRVKFDYSGDQSSVSIIGPGGYP